MSGRLFSLLAEEIFDSVAQHVTCLKAGGFVRESGSEAESLELSSVIVLGRDFKRLNCALRAF